MRHMRNVVRSGKKIKLYAGKKRDQDKDQYQIFGLKANGSTKKINK
jgi:hypothetical protein